MWAALVKQYWQVSVFKESPANTPYSLLLLIGIAIFFLVLIALQWLVTDVKNQLTFPHALGASISLSVSYMVYTFILLSLFHVANRTVQTLSCLLAGHLIVHVIAFPLLLIIPVIAVNNIPQPFGLLFGIVYLILTLILTVWQFMLTAYIYKQALVIEYLPAILASLGLLATNILIISLWR